MSPHGPGAPIAKVGGDCPLTSREVHEVVAARASTIPLPTKDITDICKAAYPHYRNIISYKVMLHLEYLQRRGRVVSYQGEQQAEQLQALGVVSPHKRWRYWALPAQA